MFSLIPFVDAYFFVAALPIPSSVREQTASEPAEIKHEEINR